MDRPANVEPFTASDIDPDIFIASLPHKMSELHARIDAIKAALELIFTREDEFRSALGEHWSGDPLSDAIDAARDLVKEIEP